MSGDAGLERRYRRLLACYPATFRREHDEEILAVLMAGAAEGKRRPGLAETIDLLRSGVFMRVRETSRLRVPTSWAYRHRSVVIPVRILLAIWILVVAGLLFGNGHSAWWAALLVPAAALNFYLLYRVWRYPANR
jgi:hypothetical protein